MQHSTTYNFRVPDLAVGVPYTGKYVPDSTMHFPDLKTEVPYFRSGGVRHNLNTGYNCLTVGTRPHVTQTIPHVGYDLLNV